MPRLPHSPFYQDQDSLIHFFSILAFSSESELGFDTEIERVNNSDFELCFCIEEVRYLTYFIGPLKKGVHKNVRN